MTFNQGDHVLICGEPFTVLGVADAETGRATVEQTVSVHCHADGHAEFWDSRDLARHQVPWVKMPDWKVWYRSGPF